MTRRGNKEGTIYQRADGSWCAQVSVNGKRLSKYGKTRTEVRTWLTDTLAKQQQGILVNVSKVTVGEYFAQFLKDVEASLRPRTHIRYEELIRLHILPELGKLRLTALQPVHLQQLYTTKLEEGLSPSTVQRVHNLAHRGLKLALRLGLVYRNVADAVVPPRPGKSEIKALNPDEVSRLLQAANGDRLRVLYLLAVATGLRQGELLALRWSDLDWDAGTLSVARSVQRVKGQGIKLLEPKTKAGRRVVVLPPSALNELREHQKQQHLDRLLAGPDWQKLDLIFASEKGTYLDGSNVRRSFAVACRRAGLQGLHFHCLRHTAATLLLLQGTNPKIVQEMLGHSQIGITLDTYSHVLPSMQQQAAEMMEKVLTRKLQ